MPAVWKVIITLVTSLGPTEDPMLGVQTSHPPDLSVMVELRAPPPAFQIEKDCWGASNPLTTERLKEVGVAAIYGPTYSVTVTVLVEIVGSGIHAEFVPTTVMVAS